MRPLMRMPGRMLTLMPLTSASPTVSGSTAQRVEPSPLASLQPR